MDRQVAYTDIAPEARTGIKRMESAVDRSDLDDALVVASVAMNSWNRLWVSFRTPDIPDL